MAACTPSISGIPGISDADLGRFFESPPPGYGEVPFFWWMGDALTKERLSWELDRLEGLSISALQVNYAHSDKGGLLWGLTIPSDPPLFSEAWWELFNWFLKDAGKRGISVSLSDYTLCSPGQGWHTDAIIAEHPEIRGSTLEALEREASGGETLGLVWHEETLCMAAYRLDPPGDSCIGDAAVGGTPPRTVLDRPENGEPLAWTCPPGRWRIIEVRSRLHPMSIDPMNPLSGRLVTERFFQPFEDRNPGEGGKGLNFFFSDELNFGVSGNLWNRRFAREFRERKGYDLVPELPALFADWGQRTAKVRLDYRDVLVRLEEESYFKPVYDWHESRGMIYGCDHGGRGKDVLEFGDYFRTQKWNQAPGNDNPFLEADIIKNKTASSIAHLYERPRTWLEGFHSSGWGTSTADLADALFRNFVMGHNLVSLHGLYYSTYGGWWEWAPPCNHFRMPYASHLRLLMKCSERLCFLLSQGVHRCDVAVLYPVAPCEAGLGGEESVAAAFSLGESLFRAGIDFDFMDFESLERAKVATGIPSSPATVPELRVAGEAYRVLVLPAMKAVRFSTLEKALAFHRSGGLVLALDCVPVASERIGSDDPQLDAMVAELFGASGHLLHSDAEVLSLIGGAFPRDFLPLGFPSGSGDATDSGDPADSGESGRGPWVLHRSLGCRELYAVYGAREGSECFFRSRGRSELWDPWTGGRQELMGTRNSRDGTIVRMPLAESELQLIVFDRSAETVFPEAVPAVMPTSRTFRLSENWNFSLVPTRDNRYGDFRLPASEGLIGAELGRLRWFDCFSGSSGWRTASASFGPRFLIQGPLGEAVIIEELKEEDWRSYEYSERWGIEGDPGHQGYHGLKGEMSDAFLAFGRLEFTPTDSVYAAEPEGPLYFLRTFVHAGMAGAHVLNCGTLRPEEIRVNGRKADPDGDSVELDTGLNAILLSYRGPGRTWFVIEETGAAPGWNQEYPLAMGWYRKPGVLSFDPYGCFQPGPGRAERFRFISPPALKALDFLAFGKVEVSVAGRDIPVRMVGTDGAAIRYQAMVDVVSAPCVEVELVVHPLGGQNGGHHGGALFPEPLRLDCGEGTIGPGDWSAIEGLLGYSGGARYRKSLSLEKPRSGERAILDLGDVVSSAEVTLNGKPAGTRVAPPWKFDLTDLVSDGDNELGILVYNTLANHYTNIPTRYRGSTRSGLLGPVSIGYQHRHLRK